MRQLQHNHTKRREGHGRFLKLALLSILILAAITLPSSAAPIELSDQLLTAQALGSVWVFQGPAPQVNAQQDLTNVPKADEPVSGAVVAIAASPTNPDLVYLGAANGGVWKTTNATDPNPTWTPLTDHLQSLSIGIDALALDPLDPADQTVIVGTGRFSGYANRGDDYAGIYYTTDGGATWTVSTDAQLSAARITGVAARGNTMLVASENGLFRSTGGPLGTWTKISGTGGLPDARAGDIAPDPNDNNRFYVTFVGASGGLFRSDDLGATWTNVTGAISGITASTDAFDVAVYNDGTTSAVSVVLNGVGGDAESEAFYRSVNGGTFTALDVPTVFKDAYGKFGIVADKTNPDLFYVSGGYDLVGSDPWKAPVYRVDASRPSGSQLTHLDSAESTKTLSSTVSDSQTYMYVQSTVPFLVPPPFNVVVDNEEMTVTAITPTYSYFKLTVVRGVNGTTPAFHGSYSIVASLAAYGTPHVDVNTLAGDANGGLWQGAHGGIHLLPQPANATSAANYWVSKNNNLGVTEMHDIAYDHVTDTLIGANQDNCVVIQSAPGDLTWPVGSGWSGDGGDVAVADLGDGTSIRYGANQNIGSFQRQVFDADNNLVSKTTLSTSVITDKQFTTPIAVNAVDPHRLLIGGSANLYESLDMGDTINKIATVGVYNRAIAYGGRRNGVDNPDVFYVVDSAHKLHARTTANGTVVTKSLPTGLWYVRDIVINPEDWMNLFASDYDDVFASTDGGDTWTKITGNLLSISSVEIQTIEFVEAPSPYIVVGTRSGVFASYVDALGSWFELGTDLPDVMVFELDYDAVDDVLAAATLGRGAWLLPDASTAVAPVGVPPVLTLSGDITVDEGSTHTYTFTVDDPGDLFTVDSLTVGAGGELVSGSLVTTATGGSFQVTYPDGPASVSVSLQVLDSTGELSTLETLAVTVNNVKPSVAILGAPTSGSPGTTVNLSSLVTDPSPTDTAAGFTYYWIVQKYVDGVFVGNFAFGDAADFSYTPDVTGKYNVFFKAQDQDGVWSNWAFKAIYAASPDLTADTFVVTVPEGATAANLGTFQNVNGNPLTLSASVGTLTRIDDSLVPITVQGYWKLGEDDPGAADGLPGTDPTLGRDENGLNAALDLTRVGSPTYTSANHLNGDLLAMSFDGSSGYYVASPILSATDNFGIEAWVRPTGTDTIHQAIAYNGNWLANGYGLTVGPDGNFYGRTSVWIDTGVEATLNTWSHVALVRDNGTTKMYVNGTLVVDDDTISAPNTPLNNSSIGLGKRLSLLTNYLQGSVDDVRVFTFDPGTFDPNALNYPSSVSGTWSWSYDTGDGAVDGQDVTITAIDDVNAEVTSLPFSLVVENIAPSATLSNDGPVSENSSSTVSFSDQFDPSTADTTAGFRYAYDFDNDGVFEVGDGSYAGSSANDSETVPASFLADGPGTRTVRARILDKDGGYTDYTTTITINNVAPTASISGPADGLVSQVVSFLLGGNDAPADQAAGFTYDIDWGDGSSETVDPVAGTGDAIARHAYAAAGNYTVQVTATDKDGASSAAPATTSIQINPADVSNLETIVASAPFVELAVSDNAALQNAVAVINAMDAPTEPKAITLILGDGPYSGVTLSPPDNVILNLAGNDTKDVDGTLISSATGPAVTVTSGEVFIQGNVLETSADAPAVLVTGGHLTLDQDEIHESGGFLNVAVKIAGGSANLGFDVLMHIQGEGAFVDTYARSALVPHPEGIDAELTPNTYQATEEVDDGSTIYGTIAAVSLSSTSVSSSESPSVIGGSVTFTAIVDVKAIEHGLATGKVRFYDGETLLGEGVVNYVGGQFVAEFTTDALSIGGHVITAVYSGNEAYVASSTELTHEVVEPPNDPPVADANGPYLGAINTDIQFDGTGSYDPNGDSLTYNWDFGDGNTGTVVMPTHLYSEAGIYDVCLAVNDGELDSELSCTIAVVYDPSGGFVTGGGWITSPAGAYTPDPTLTGKATFGFVCKYKKGANVPTGNTEFQFKAGNLNFHSDTYDWLVVTGSNYARFKGTGTINGEGTYKFLIWAGDGTGSSGGDTFRIKIWWEDSDGEHVIYDNGMDQAISGGSIVVHKVK